MFRPKVTQPDAMEIAIELAIQEEVARLSSQQAVPPPPAKKVTELPAGTTTASIKVGNTVETFSKDQNFVVPKGYIIYLDQEGTMKRITFQTETEWTSLVVQVDGGQKMFGTYSDYEAQNYASYDPNTLLYSFTLYNVKFTKEFYLKIDAGLTITSFYALYDLVV